MCGILGVRRSFVPSREAALAALKSLRWRGPDGAKLISAGDWYLGVTRLAITDPSSPQPITSRASGKIVLFNGAVTSAESEWRAHGAAAQTHNDAELALLRLEAGGPAALAATSGPHAFAILDPVRDDLWLARDPEGEKPLFVVCDHRRVVAFASTVAALRPLGLKPRLLPEEMMRLLRFGFCLGPSLDADGLELRADLRGVFEARGGGRPRRIAAVAEDPGPASFRERVKDAVARCARAEVPVGLCLSGGLDSACIAASLQHADLSLPAYQFAARGTHGDERRRAREVALCTGMELRTVDGGPEILSALPELTRRCGLPLGDPSVLAVHALARRAREDGVAVLLSGEGADDLWLGYRRHRAAAWLPRHGLTGLPVPGLANGEGARLVRALGSARPYDALLAVTPPAFLKAVLREGILPPGDLPTNGEVTSLARARHLDRTFYLRHDLLPKLDTALMAAGIEGRCPFLDPLLLSCAETRNPKPRRILGKRGLRAAFGRDLPRRVRRARKRGFSLPLDAWLRQGCAISDLLEQERTQARDHLDAEGLRRMLDLHRRGRARLGHALYLVAALEVHERDLEDGA